MFENAKSIFIKNKRSMTNFQSGYKCSFEAEPGRKYTLNITGASLYRVYLNGEFIFYGPARAPHGYIRCDEIPLDVKCGTNTICISLAGYNCPCFYIPEIKPFIRAEIFEDSASVAYTGRDFAAISLDGLRTRQSYRYSFQRAFTEVWSFDNSDKLTNWMSEAFESEPVCEHIIEEELLKREWEYPRFATDNSAREIRHGKFVKKNDFDGYRKRYISNFPEGTVGFLPQQIADKTMEETYGIFYSDFSTDMSENRYTMYEFAADNTGFINTKLLAEEDSEVYLLFGEKPDTSNIYNSIYTGITGDDVVNIVKYTLKKSDRAYDLKTFECYTLKYLAILVRKGSIRVENVSLTEYSYPEYEHISFKSDDEPLNRIFEAARNTYRQNVLDTFMDCPGRERGGWLCDSYFTGQSSLIFSGSGRAEELFLKNFVSAKYFPQLPYGMLPHNYPGEVRGFIPQWAMWYILEVYEYLSRHNDDKELFKDTIYGILGFFRQYETEEGILGKTAGWSFIEWSLANEMAGGFDISYPSNMLYAKALECVGEMYDDAELISRAARIKTFVEENAFDGEHFIDGAKYDVDGRLIGCAQISEACQYYAAYFGFAPRDDKRFERFYDLLLNTYGAGRKKKGILPEVAFSSLFIGLTIRLCVLEKLGEYERLIDEIKGIYGPMAQKSMTLWEIDTDSSSSYCHGYSSIAAVLIMKALTGIKHMDIVNRRIFVSDKICTGIGCNIGLSLDIGDIGVSVNNGKRKITVSDDIEVIYISKEQQEEYHV